MKNNQNQSSTKHAHGFSMVEVVLSTVILSVLLTSALSTISAAKKGGRVMLDKAIGTELALNMMDELSLLKYEEITGDDSIGTESGEDNDDRRDKDDIDDYHGWSQSPPLDIDNRELPYTDYTRSVEVVWVDSDLNVVGSNSQMKRVSVTITRGTVEVGKAVRYFSLHGLNTTMSQQIHADTVISESVSHTQELTGP